MEQTIAYKYRKNMYSDFTHFYCTECKETFEIKKGELTTNYGMDKNNDLFCYPCCGKRDEETMRETGKAILYLTSKDGEQAYVSNWPGTLKINVPCVKKGRHNWGINRYSFWFQFDGYWWYGVQYGDNTQICHCKKTKERTNNA